MTEAERRRRSRAEFRGWVAIAAGGVHRMARGRDLSAEGIGLSLADPSAFEKESVQSEFALPGFFIPLALCARVAWVDPDAQRLGLRFKDVDADLEELLENYVAGRL